MTTFRHAYLLFLFLGVALSAQAQRGPNLITATDLFKIQQLGDVTVSPDGRMVAYTVRRIVQASDDAYDYRTHIYLVSASGGPAQQLTRGEHSATQPAWHPSGDTLAFVRSVDGTPQVFVLSMFGGEPYQLTHAEHGATDPRWSPDGRRLLYASRLPHHAIEGDDPPWPAERPGDPGSLDPEIEANPDGPLGAVRAWLHANADSSNPRVLTRLDLQGEFDLEPALRYRHLFVIGTAEGSAAQAVTSGFTSFGGGTWVGEAVVASGAVDSTRHPDRVRDRHLYRFDVETGGSEVLLAMDGYALTNPQASPDGQTLAFQARALDDASYAQTELGIYPLDGTTPPRLLTLGFDRSVQQPAWSKDGWFLYFAAPSNGGFPLYRVPAFDDIPDALYADFVADSLARLADDPMPIVEDSLTTVVDSLQLASADSTMRTTTALATPEPPQGPPVVRLTSFSRGVRSFDVTNATAFYVITEVANPYELYTSDFRFADERRLTDHNASWLADKVLSYPEARLLRRDSLDVPYWVMPPANAANGKIYPLLLAIHGGPAAMWGPGEATMWHEFQYFAAQGYGLVYANPRGSGGYGLTYKRLNYQDWGDGPASDVLAAATSAARLPWVDASQQVVTGGSYAGYLTAWIVAHDDRFKAAVAQRGVYDLAAFLGEGNAWRLVPDHFGGYPWETSATALQIDTTVALSDSLSALSVVDTSATPMPMMSEIPEIDYREILLRNSPLTYVADINTPLLIIHADNDLRTGVTQSEALYKSLKILNKPVEYVRYPDAGHDLSRTGNPKQRLDRLLRIYEFMERYVR